MSGARSSGRSVAAHSAANPQSRADQTIHYRHYAAQLRVLADDDQNRLRRTKLAKLARRYTELAGRAETKP
jgi:hypothetical protein